jgi:putative endonuclease
MLFVMLVTSRIKEIRHGVSKYCVYIIRCFDGTLYTGITTDIHRRIQQHNRGKAARYTRGRRPVTLVYCNGELDCGIALREERRIKKLSRSKKESLICLRQ